MPSAAPPPPLLPLFHGADANTPTPVSCEATDLQGLSYVRVQLNLVPSGARPMRRTSTSPPSPSRISEADFTGTPSETGDLTRVVSGVIGAERLHSWGVWSCTRAGTPLPAPPSRGMRVWDSLENVLILEILAAVVPVRKFLDAGNRCGNKCSLLAKTEPVTPPALGASLNSLS